MTRRIVVVKGGHGKGINYGSDTLPVRFNVGFGEMEIKD